MNTIISQKLKATLYLVLYWVFGLIIPIFLIYNYKYDGTGVDLPGYFSLYVIFVAPFLFVIPFKLAKLISKKEKSYYIFFGLILPYLLIYFLIYLDFEKILTPLFYNFYCFLVIKLSRL